MTEQASYTAGADCFGEPSVFRNGVWMEPGVAERLLPLFEAAPAIHGESARQLRQALHQVATMQDTREAA